jgi:cytochrome c oxidase subunit 2
MKSPLDQFDIINIKITSVDDSWSVPVYGIKVDAVPGSLNQVITAPTNLGIYYGQCSELCGGSHGLMPIKVNVMSLSDYYNLILKLKK